MVERLILDKSNQGLDRNTKHDIQKLRFLTIYRKKEEEDEETG